MTSNPHAVPDPVMDAILAAVGLGHQGEEARARSDLLALWSEIGVAGDAFHRCVVAHYLADLHADPAEALVWDVRALDAADALSDERAQEHHASLQVAGFHPSLHLNLADDLRRLGAFDAAAEHIAEAIEHFHALPAGAYGDVTRSAVREVASAINRRDTTKRASAPSPTG